MLSSAGRPSFIIRYEPSKSAFQGRYGRSGTDNSKNTCDPSAGHGRAFLPGKHDNFTQSIRGRQLDGNGEELGAEKASMSSSTIQDMIAFTSQARVSKNGRRSFSGRCARTQRCESKLPLTVNANSSFPLDLLEASYQPYHYFLSLLPSFCNQ